MAASRNEERTEATYEGLFTSEEVLDGPLAVLLGKAHEGLVAAVWGGRRVSATERGDRRGGIGRTDEGAKDDHQLGHVHVEFERHLPGLFAFAELAGRLKRLVHIGQRFRKDPRSCDGTIVNQVRGLMKSQARGDGPAFVSFSLSWKRSSLPNVPKTTDPLAISDATITK